TDRFEVVWHLNSEGVMARMEGRQRPSTLPNLLEQGIVVLNETRFDADNLPVPPTQPRAASGNTLLMEIPANFQTVKQKSFDLALRWREHTRQLFERFFENGYVVVDFVLDKGGNGRRRSFYLLQKG
ncbi:MAG: hypothetical protein GY803_22470, partial [Chloroflexi bacterium]|nr:hypothetical protein [Chloroflexota bacterium]